ncbi:MAG: hypothetical protein KGJ77_01115 [Acidobacteriota bacterium]|nr:hypothetical protein [Acidobacteriota bacterium]
MPRQRPVRSSTAAAPARPAKKPKAAPKAADPSGQPTTRRGRFFRRVMQIGPVRGFYARRLLRFLEKSKKKGRDLPDQLADLDEYLAKVPAKQRRELLEASLSGELDARAGRAVRRAAGRQGRQKGRAAGGQRPGMPPAPGPRPRPQ